MSKRTKWLLAIGVIAALVVGWQVVAFAGPVGQESGFEDDDGNLAPGDVIVTGQPSPNFDWNSFRPTTWTGTAPYRESDKVESGWTFKGIEDDEVDTTDTAFAGGVKQDDDCADLIGAKAPNKDDLKRIYLSTKVVGGDTFLNLAWVRIPQNTTSPSAHVGFEFNQGDTLCDNTDPDGLVERTDGDLLIVYDFQGGATNTPRITLREWTTDSSDTCDVDANSPPCWGEATNLTNLGFAEAKVNTTSSAIDRIAPSPPETLGLNEFGEAGINLTDAGVFPAGSCETFGTAFGVSRSSGNSGTAQMKDIVGPADFSLSNCGEIKIIKRTSPRGENQNFSFTSTISGSELACTADATPASFTLNDDAGVDNSANTEHCVNVPAGNYTVTEGADPSGFAFTDLSCTASGTGTSATPTSGNATKTANITMGASGSVTCVYTNTLQQGAIKILKKSTKTGNPLVSNAGAVFSYDDDPSNPPAAVSVTDNGTGDEDSTVGEVCVSGLKPGAYTVNETSPPSGYGSASQTNLTANAVANTDCTNNQPAAADTVTFTNPPLADIQVRFRDGGSGETKLTSAGISCDNPTGTTDTTDTSNWDDTTTVTGIKAGASTVTVTCTIPIDP